MCWEANYRSPGGKPFTILGTATNECPVSLVSDASMRRVQWYVRVKMLFKASGASPYGGDLNKWPALDVDAFTILEQESIKVDNLMLASDRPPKR